MNKHILFVLLGLALSGTARAGLMTVDFEADPAGHVPNGFASASTSAVRFYAPALVNLRIYSGAETDGNSLLLESDDDSGLDMLFDFPIYSIALDFGNDDPLWHPEPDWALLTLFNGGVQIAQVSLQANHDDLMNQTISYAGLAFDQASFRYVDSELNGIGLAEVIDNIRFSNSASLPAPGSIGLLGLAIVLLGCRGVQRKSRPQKGCASNNA